VTSAKIITDRQTGQPRGFGFVEMETKSEGQKAISMLNGRTVDGRPLAVNEAKPQQKSGFGGRPARSSADLAQFLGELRDFKGMMKQTAKLLASTAFQLPKSWYSRWSWLRNKDAFDTATAGHYLNYQFGWKPFVNDILKFYKSMAKVESTIRFIRKNNNKWLKRGGTVHRDRSVTEGTISCRVKPVLNTYFHLAPGCTLPYPDTKTVTIKSERVWFKARMKYYIPGLKVDSCESIWSSPLLRRIYGLELTPALLWELTPWSWLVDWFADVGDVIANMSSLNHDNLVAKYAYVMRSERETTYLFTPWKIGTTQGVLNLDMTSSYYLDSKERHAASPYGFGVGWDDFSPYQLSILMALGLTR
jgi:hypothetical protein